MNRIVWDLTFTGLYDGPIWSLAIGSHLAPRLR